MADITKCAGRNCPAKKTCTRYMIKESQYQSWAAFEVGIDIKKGKCPDYLVWRTKAK